MEMPKLLEEHRKLEKLAGTWTGEERVYPSPWDPKGGKATGRMQFRLDLDNFFLVSEYVEERGGLVTYRGLGVYGWDPAEKCYTMHWFDSMGAGSPVPARGTWEGDKLTFEMRSPHGVSRYEYTFEGESRLAFRIEHSRDGKQWALFMEATYRRQ